MMLNNTLWTAEDAAKYIIRTHPLNGKLTPLKLQYTLMLLWAEYYRRYDDELFSVPYVRATPLTGFKIPTVDYRYGVYPGITLSPAMFWNFETVNAPDRYKEYLDECCPKLFEMGVYQLGQLLFNAGGVWDTPSQREIRSQKEGYDGFWHVSSDELKSDIRINRERKFLD